MKAPTKFPLVKLRQSYFPRNPICPICKKNKTSEPHSFAVLQGGACLMDRKKEYGGPDEKMDAFLTLAWHGAHDNGIGKLRGRYDILEIARDVRGGQFELSFCSPKCLRKFLNNAVELEKAMGAPRKTNRK
jgi:hypothetical protein